ncbi:hypothetical protein BTR23_02360 [Alkalihalophilus pseudofirmus]|nr:hypothetical protein BTR23_02360 [Alkalihalophilus pseudofirmus]
MIETLVSGFIGEKDCITDVLGVLESSNTFLINIYGEHGVGKSSLLKKIQDSSPNHTMDYMEIDREENFFDEIIESCNSKHVILLDDVDNRFSSNEFKGHLLSIYSQYNDVRIICTSKYKFFVETVPGIQVFDYEIGNRLFTYEQFEEFVQHQQIKKEDIGETILKNLYLFATYCRNFNIVMEVLDEIKIRVEEQNKSITPRQFLEIIMKSHLFSKVNRDLVIDSKNVEDSDYLFTIRIKDKIEKLRDVILEYYPDEQVLYEVMKNQFNSSFVEEAFTLPIPYEDKVLNICLSYDPIDLLVNLLGPRDIIIELKERKLGEASLTYSIEDKAKQILKNIGLNILDKPKGIEYFYHRFMNNNQLLNEDTIGRLNKEYIIGLGITLFQDLESVLYEMLNFYSNYLCGSMRNFFEIYNREVGQNIHQQRITFGQYIGLFHFMNNLAKDERYQLKLININRNYIINKKIINKLENISSYRSFFSHYQKVQNFEVPYKTYRKRISKLYVSAIDVMEEMIASDIFPEIIKIKQVVFDEFGRRLYIGSNWKDAEVRFSLSNSSLNIDIYSHYYILRKKQSLAINPVIIPRYFNDKKDLNYNGENYQKSSDTQYKQGNKLISYVNAEGLDRALDVGCGNGLTTLELYEKWPQLQIDAFDLSESMIDVAIENRQQRGIQENNVNFYVLNALDLDENNQYDLVFSNATLHWVTDSNLMYQKLYDALRTGGKLNVHQGGADCYKGLHDIVRMAIDELDLQMYYQNWTYPIYYPTKNEYENLLNSIGFRDVKVISEETDGKEYSNLVENFANAGMLPYFLQLPDDNIKNKLRNHYYKLANSLPVDQYTHRLYALAKK